MSFEKTMGSIKNLTGEVIGADEMMEMLVCVCQVVYKQNGVKNAALLPVKNQSLLLKKMHSLMRMILSVYSGNRDGLDQFLESIRNDYEATVDKLTDCDNAVSSIEEETAKLEASRSELLSSKEALEERRGHLLSLNDECKAIQQRIDRLSDPALDGLPLEKERLSAELCDLETKMTMIINAINSAKNDIVLSNSLLSDSDESRTLTIAASPDLGIIERDIRSWEDLDNWFERIMQRASALLDAGAAVLNNVVIQAESLTAEPVQE